MPTFIKCLFALTIVILVGGKTYANDVRINDLQTGAGDEAVPETRVTVHYTGWLMDGTKFDSSLDRNRPFSFTIGARQVIAGWEEGVVGMKVGGKRELIIPPELAYGSRGVGNVIPPNSFLRFEIELLEVAAPLFKNINNAEVKELLAKGVKIVDIRTPAEWKETGVIQGSLLLPFRMANGKINRNFPQDLMRIAKPEEEVILICRSGNRSHAAAELVAAQFGYKHVYNVRRGIRYWLREQNPVVQPNTEDIKNNM